MNADAVLEALADLLAERVAARIAAKPPADVDTYSSENLPPDVPSRARFHEVVKKIRGAEKRGRRWFVSAAAWRDARAKKRRVHVAPSSDVDEIIASAGFRTTR